MITSAPETSHVVLRNGVKLPLLGLGTASSVTPDNVIRTAVLAAIEAGYRLFDTASLYGTERALGDALKEAFQKGLVRRDEVFVTTKLWCSDMHPDDVLPALRKSLQELQMEYVDLYLCHWPVRLKKGVRYPQIMPDDILPVDLESTWKAMEKCVDIGLAKFIGVSNFSERKIRGLLCSARIPPAVNQVEMHPMWNRKNLREYCRASNIQVMAYSPLGGRTASDFGAGGSLLLNSAVLCVASKHCKSPAQVVLRWGIDEGASVIPKSYTIERIRENANIFDFALDNEDREKLMNLEQKKVYDGKELLNAVNGPYRTLLDLWEDDIFLDNATAQ